MDLVVVKDIEKSFDGQSVCRNINLSIKEGEFFTLLGPSGCGKTTLLRLIAGFISPEKGNIFLGEKEITRESIEKRGIGMVFQNYALFPHMTVYDNVAYGLKIKKLKKRKINEKVNQYLSLVNLDGYESRKVSELSGGEQQRVALARALVVEPKVLLLDEPLSNLDAKLKDKMRLELKEIQHKLGVTTIFVTHDQVEALTLSDRIAVFNKGNCIQVGTPNEIYLKPVNTFVATFVGDTNLFEAKSFPFDISNKNNEPYISVRPQDIKISKASNQDANECFGVVKTIKTSGALLEYSVIVNNLLIKVVTLNSLDKSIEFEVGEKVYLSIDTNRIQRLKE
ncbi:ABC transporter ATP-binding protein [Clostridium sediminicola]|uniref:ABC transporter ATP-binding protein n=1 Tax=Clostridium sediminicola TaxID=3114879 RepID=UPI0031F1EF4B